MTVINETGNDYAKRPQIDQPSFYGMRLAMFDTVKAWHALPEGERKSEKAMAMIRENCLNNPYLKGAGTTEIVARYFEDTIANASTPKGRYDASVTFLNAIPLEAAVKMEKALGQSNLNPAKYINLAQAAAPFSAAATEHLKVTTMTDSYLDFLKRSEASLATVKVQPHGLNTEQANNVKGMDTMFRAADWVDDKVFNNPAVSP